MGKDLLKTQAHLRLKLMASRVDEIIERSPHLTLKRVLFRAWRRTRKLFLVLDPGPGIFEYGNKDKENGSNSNSTYD